MKASVATEGRFISPRGACFSTINFSFPEEYMELNADTPFARSILMAFISIYLHLTSHLPKSLFRIAKVVIGLDLTQRSEPT